MEQKQAYSPPQLSLNPGPRMLWGMGVGYFISGMYFGWNPGLQKAGTYGLAIATLFIIILYITFTFSCTELSCAIPKAGVVLYYADRVPGKDIGFVAGMSQIIEFVFAPPAIAGAIGAYFHIFSPQIPVTVIAISLISLIAITTLNGKLALIYFGLPGLAYIWFHFVVKKSLNVRTVNH